MSAVSLDHVSVTFADGTVGLDDVSLDVSDGEFVALVGPSGSGKTTLLRTIAGFNAPSAGSLRIAGVAQTKTPPEQRHLGMVFQQHAVWPHMSVFDNVAYPLKRAGMPAHERKARVAEVLGTVGLADFARRRPDQLSGGQRQRVALARAIVSKPALLLLDEALSALDEPLRDQLRRELVSLIKRTGLTAIHVTHDRAEALAIADRVVVLSAGQIHQVAPPAEIISNPATPVVAAFMADATAIPVVVERGSDEVVAQMPGQALRLGVEAVDFRGDAEEASEHLMLVAPHHIQVVGADAAADDTSVLRAEVTSVLYERAGFSITAVAEGGVTLRANVHGARPSEGHHVGLKIANPWVFGR